MKFVEKLAITNAVLTQKKKILLIIILTLSILLLAILFLSGCKNSSLETLKNSDLEVPNNFETPDFSNENEPNCEDEKEADKTTTPGFKDEDNNSGDNNTGDDSPSDDDRTLPDDDRTLPDDDRTLPSEDNSKDDNFKSDDPADEEGDDEVLVPERKFEIKLTTLEDKFSYTFSNGIIYKTLGTNNAVYLSFELFENSIKVSGARFEILVSTSDVTFDKVNYNSVYLLISKSCEFDLTIKTVDGEISKTIRVVVS